MKKILFCTIASVLFGNAQAQLMLNTPGVPQTIDFTGFAGAGFQPGGGGGTLDSDWWSATGLSDGDVDFGATATTGDFAKGTTMGLVTPGGIYAVDIAGNQGLMVQPTADDFTPGSFILKIENSTGIDITELDVAYTIYVLNDAGRSNSFNFSISYDNVTYNPISDLDYTSPEAMDFTPYINNLSTSITGLSFTAGSVMYVKWTSDDVGGAGSRDEFALDDIVLTAIEGEPLPLVTFDPAGAIAGEAAGSVNPNLHLSATADCTINVSVNAASTADDADVTFASFDYSFVDGGATDYTFIVDIIDDLLDEPDEAYILDLTYISGGCAVGLPSSYTLGITDNDTPPPPVYTEYAISAVTAVDGDGVNTQVGTLAELTGVVHGINTWDGGLQFALIDATGGISVFSFDNTFGYTVTEGDEITVQGVISQFNGLSEIEPDTLWFVDAGNPLQTPSVVTLLSESTESQMTTIQNLTYVDIAQWLGDGSSFNVQLTDGVNTYTIRIDNNSELATMTAPAIVEPYVLHVTGIGNQFDTGAPYLDGYQLFPRYATDIVVDAQLSIPVIDASPISIYPNPAIDVISVLTDVNIDNIVLTDLRGAILFSTRVIGNAIEIPVHQLAPGTYMIRVENNNQTETQLFIKQ